MLLGLWRPAFAKNFRHNVPFCCRAVIFLKFFVFFCSFLVLILLKNYTLWKLVYNNNHELIVMGPASDTELYVRIFTPIFRNPAERKVFP